VNNEGVTTDYFATMRIPIVAGRPFTPSDRSDPSVVIVSRSLAALLWPGQNAVGKRMLTSFSLRPFRSDVGAVQWQTVVGVAADVRYREIERARFDVYLPVAQADAPVNDFVIRMRENSPATIPAVRETIRRLEPGVPVRLRTMSSMVDGVTATWRMFLVIIGAFAAFAMVLTATGLYGLLTYLVQERTYEIGVRMALGAAPAQIRRAIVGGAAGLMLWGILVGLCASLVAGRVMRSLVFEVSPADPVTVLGAACVLMAIGLLATLLPSIQAMRVDPTRALRAE
jgi:putative ABC transport system permease protein